MKTIWFIGPRMERMSINNFECVKMKGIVRAKVRLSTLPSHESVVVVSGLVIRTEVKIKAGATPNRLRVSLANISHDIT
jgi:hypothetical protein